MFLQFLKASLPIDVRLLLTLGSKFVRDVTSEKHVPPNDLRESVNLASCKPEDWNAHHREREAVRNPGGDMKRQVLTERGLPLAESRKKLTKKLTNTWKNYKIILMKITKMTKIIKIKKKKKKLIIKIIM